MQVVAVVHLLLVQAVQLRQMVALERPVQLPARQ
jgi:hypothetical protein